KYQLTTRNWDKPGNIKPFLTRLNKARRENSALHTYANIEFVPCDNEQMIAYYKWSEDRSNVVLVVVNLDPHVRQETNIHLPLEAMGIAPGSAFTVWDLIYEEAYTWRESTNFVALDPRTKPVHVFRVEKS
ncbi:MAG: alpha-1,4-glucan--maltose-1-phosphate maltosyltransferase, partial [Verrucomicrobiota bacterium]